MKCLKTLFFVILTLQLCQLPSIAQQWTGNICETCSEDCEIFTDEGDWWGCYWYCDSDDNDVEVQTYRHSFQLTPSQLDGHSDAYLTDIIIWVEIDHNDANDLIGRVTFDNNQITLFENAGGYYNNDDIKSYFRQSGRNFGTPLASYHTMKPQSGNFANWYNKEILSSTFDIYVEDDQNYDDGTMIRWCINLEYNYPTPNPTKSPTKNPTKYPTNNPTINPTTKPPTQHPTSSPSVIPTNNPSLSPTTPSPTLIPSTDPSKSPVNYPTDSPTKRPSLEPSSVTSEPSNTPSIGPTANPSVVPTDGPSYTPSKTPTVAPTIIPSLSPSKTPSLTPTKHPTATPSVVPTLEPTVSPIENWDENHSFELVLRVHSVSNFLRTYEKLRDILYLPVENTYTNITKYQMLHDIRIILKYIGPFPVINGSEGISYTFGGYTYDLRYNILFNDLSKKNNVEEMTKLPNFIIFIEPLFQLIFDDDTLNVTLIAPNDDTKSPTSSPSPHPTVFNPDSGTSKNGKKNSNMTLYLVLIIFIVLFCLLTSCYCYCQKSSALNKQMSLLRKDVRENANKLPKQQAKMHQMLSSQSKVSTSGASTGPGTPTPGFRDCGIELFHLKNKTTNGGELGSSQQFIEADDSISEGNDEIHIKIQTKSSNNEKLELDGPDTSPKAKENFSQMLNDNKIGQNFLMDDIINDMEGGVTTPQMENYVE